MCNRTITSEEREILLASIRSDASKRRAYIEAIGLDAMLTSEFSAFGQFAGSNESAASDTLFEFPGEDVGFHERIRRTIERGGKTRLEPTRTGHETRTEFLTTACVTRFHATEARCEGRVFRGGSRLEPGLIEVAEGSMDLTFDSGAVMSLEGPARLRVESEHRASLFAGRITVRVPEQAVGFLILTPNSYLRDLGTTFAIKVNSDSETELHVFDGVVEATPAGPDGYRSSWIVRANQAVLLGPDGIRNIRFEKNALLSGPKISTTPETVPVRFNFDNWDGNRTVSQSGYEMRIYRDESPCEPILTDGVSGSAALRFDGKNLYGRTDFSGIGGSEPRTVTFWIRLAPDVPTDRLTPNGILSWGLNRPTKKWQVAWNTGRYEGTVGAPRIEFGSGYVIGSTDLRDGRWHHVAVVYFGGENSDVSTHIRIYVDGGLETPTGRLQQKISTDISDKAAPMMIGRYLGRWENRERFYFEGEIDDVRVYPAPLLPSQIVGIMDEVSLNRM